MRGKLIIVLTAVVLASTALSTTLREQEGFPTAPVTRTATSSLSPARMKKAAPGKPGSVCAIHAVRFANQYGAILDKITTGQQVIIAVSVQNTGATSPIPFTAVVEAKDAEGATAYLQWQPGILTPDSNEIPVDLPWTPDKAGIYTMRIFVISSLEDMRVLSPIVTQTVTVE